MPDEPRCAIHRLRLEPDALRGLVCPACDAESARWPADVQSWLARTIGRLLRRLRSGR